MFSDAVLHAVFKNKAFELLEQKEWSEKLIFFKFQRVFWNIKKFEFFQYFITTRVLQNFLTHKAGIKSLRHFVFSGYFWKKLLDDDILIVVLIALGIGYNTDMVRFAKDNSSILYGENFFFYVIKSLRHFGIFFHFFYYRFIVESFVI